MEPTNMDARDTLPPPSEGITRAALRARGFKYGGHSCYECGETIDPDFGFCECVSYPAATKVYLAPVWDVGNRNHRLLNLGTGELEYAYFQSEADAISAIGQRENPDKVYIHVEYSGILAAVLRWRHDRQKIGIDKAT